MRTRYPETDQTHNDKRESSALASSLCFAKTSRFAFGSITCLCFSLFACALSSLLLSCSGPAETAQADFSAMADSSVSQNNEEAITCGGHADCDDGNECTEGLCGVEGVCRFQVLVGAACDDGDPCTQGALCLADGDCGGPGVGAMPAPECFSCVCDSETGMDCEPMPEGALCENPDPCFLDSTCDSEGRCEGESACIHGSCMAALEGGFLCSCEEGWSGERCAVPDP